MPDEPTPPASLSNAALRRIDIRAVVRALTLSRIQSVVAILAGAATVFGAAISLAQAGRPARTGTLVATVHASGAAPTLADARVEILTPDNALVAALTPDVDGRVTQALREGVYVVRVTEPRSVGDVHRIDVQPGQTVAVTATLRPGSASSNHSLNKGVSAIRRALGIR